MIATATRWNPLLVSLFASLGGALGELSGYYAGYLGKKIAIAEHIKGYDKVAGWINKYNLWAIFFLALQPILPFDISGMVAGANDDHCSKPALSSCTAPSGLMFSLPNRLFPLIVTLAPSPRCYIQYFP